MVADGRSARATRPTGVGDVSMADLPPHVRARVQRILDEEARRRLHHRLDGEARGALREIPASRRDVDPLDERCNERALSA